MGLAGSVFKIGAKTVSKTLAKPTTRKVLGTASLVGGTAALVAGSSVITTATAKPTTQYEYHISSSPTTVNGDVYGGIKADATTNKTNNDPLSNLLSSGAGSGSGSEGGGIGPYIPIIAIAGLGIAGLYVYSQKKR